MNTNPDQQPGLMMQAFDFNEQPVRVIQQGGEPWFVAADVCRVLEIVNARDAVKSLDEDEKMTVGNADGHSGQRGGAQFYNLISESGLYALIFKSRKPEAKVFRKWVTAEVLPALRRTGAYQLPSGLDTEVVSLLSFVRETCAGWSLERRMEFGLKARRYAKAVGVVFQTVTEPGVGRCFAFPRSLLDEVRREHQRSALLPDSDAAEFERLLEALHTHYGEEKLPHEVVRGLAKLMRLFPAIFGPNTSLASERSAFGKLCARFDHLAFPSGYVLKMGGGKNARYLRVEKTERAALAA